MYPPTSLLRTTLCALLCGVVLSGPAHAVNAQSVTKAGTGGKGVGARPGTPLAPQSTFTFSNSSPITINDVGAATPYPSNITVAGFAASVSTVRVRLNNLSHARISNIDILLVSPAGQKFILMSDVEYTQPTGGSNATYTFDDAAADFMPATAGVVPSGTYKPTNYGVIDIGGTVCQDPFPATAPAGPYLSPGPFSQCGAETLASAFGGTNPNGTWSLYVVDDTAPNTGSIAGGWDLLFDVPGVTPAVGDLVISELRFNGPGPGGNDQLVEVQNVSNQTLDLSGLKLRIDTFSPTYSDVSINNGTFLLPGQHFLAAHSPGYSLGAVATPDQTFSPVMFCGVQLTLANNTVLDQVGTGCNSLNTGEGTRLTLNIAENNTQSSYVRKLTSGTPQDTNNNAADFVRVALDPTQFPAGSTVLGAPGPENLASPSQRNATIKAALIDQGCTITTIGPDNSTSCSRNRDPTPDAANNSDFGTLSIRRTFINHTGQQVTALRFRIVDVTTQNSPGAGASQADLRGRNSHAFTPVCLGAGAGCGGPGARAAINGTTLEAPTTANNGGLNTSLVVNPFATDGAGTLTLVNPLADGAGISLQFILGVKQTGSYRFFINVEALP